MSKTTDETPAEQGEMAGRADRRIPRECPGCGYWSLIYRQREPHFWCRKCGWRGNEPKQ